MIMFSPCAVSSPCSEANLCALLSSYSGDIEKKHKLEISPLCDSEANTIASVQIGKNQNILIYELTLNLGGKE